MQGEQLALEDSPEAEIPSITRPEIPFEEPTHRHRIT